MNKHLEPIFKTNYINRNNLQECAIKEIRYKLYDATITKYSFCFTKESDNKLFHYYDQTMQTINYRTFWTKNVVTIENWINGRRWWSILRNTLYLMVRGQYGTIYWGVVCDNLGLTGE